MISTLSDLLGNSHKTISNWKKEKRPIINLLYKYFLKEELKEFLETGEIKKFEKLNFLYNEVIGKNQKLYIESFTTNFRYLKLSSAHAIFEDFYFSFLLELKENKNLISSDFNSLLSLFINNYLLDKYINTINDKEYINSAIDAKFHNFKNDQKYFDDVILADEKILAFAKEEIEKKLKMFNNEDFKTIQKHLKSFKNWDSYMMIYLDYIFKSDLQIFIESENEELLYHAVGFNVYLNLKEEKPRIKLNLISMIIDRVKKEEISVLKIEEIIKDGKYLEYLKSTIVNNDNYDKYVLEF
jgi:hypothetical protein